MSTEKPNDNMIVMRLDDKACRGDLVVEKTANGYVLWLEIEDIGGTFWERTDEVKTLEEAMRSMAEIIVLNCDNYFYED